MRQRATPALQGARWVVGGTERAAAAPVRAGTLQGRGWRKGWVR